MSAQSRKERGQSLVILSVATLTMFGALSLAVDVGFTYFRQQAQRAAADAAALAAAKKAYVAVHGGGSFCNSSFATCQSATACANPVASPPQTNMDSGCAYAQTNGYASGGNSGRQQVLIAAGTGNPPGTAGLRTDYWVTATVSDSIPQLFAGIFGQYFMSPSVYATAGVIIGTPGGCIYALNTGNTNDFVESGGASRINTTCGIYVNSSSSNALTVSGGAQLTVTGATINVVGGANVSGGSTVTPAPTTGVSAAANPYASVPVPTIASPVSCDHINYSLSGGSDRISQGVYCGGITNSGGTLNFNPGLYILYGGGLTSSSSSGDLEGSGVTFYNTAGGGYSYSPITISGGGTANLSAMTSGSQAGLLFFEDPTITSSKKNTVSGGSSSSFTGGMYFKNDNLTYSGGSILNPEGITIVAGTITVSGGSTITGYNGGIGGRSPAVALVQ